MPMTGSIDRVEVITSVQRRRRWSAEEKARIVQETYAPGMSVSLIARQHGVAPNQVFKWRQLYGEGALSAVGAGEEVVAASELGLGLTRIGGHPEAFPKGATDAQNTPTVFA
jgi:transposase